MPTGKRTFEPLRTENKENKIFYSRRCSVLRCSQRTMLRCVLVAAFAACGAADFVTTQYFACVTTPFFPPPLARAAASHTPARPPPHYTLQVKRQDLRGRAHLEHVRSDGHLPLGRRRRLLHGRVHERLCRAHDLCLNHMLGDGHGRLDDADWRLRCHRDAHVHRGRADPRTRELHCQRAVHGLLRRAPGLRRRCRPHLTCCSAFQQQRN